MQIEETDKKTPYCYNMETYATYSLFPENEKFSKRYVSTKICVSPSASYKIYNYDKTILSCLDTIHNQYRSVVCSYPENKLLCFSPPKSMEYCDFIKKYPKMIESPNKKGELPIKNIIATEKIEGISIQLFYDERIGSWEISTKTNISGNYWYFNNERQNTTTFRDMFMDALIHDRSSSLNTNPWINILPKSHCYSFVLQHPENQIVLPLKRPKLWLIAIYRIVISKESLAIQIPSFEYKNWRIFNDIIGIVDFPKELNVETYEELQKYVLKYKNHPFRLSKGIVIWNEKTGERTTLNNENYKDLVILRSLVPDFQYEYLCMKRAQKIDEYLQFFPQYKKNVMAMNRLYDDFVNTLHRCYMDVYVFKTECFDNVSHQYKPHVENLHKKIYLRNLHTRHPVKITKKCVSSYIEHMEPREQLYMLSYLRRERDNMY